MRSNGENGFSLVELTLAVFLTIGLMGTIFFISNQNKQIFVTETHVTNMNANVRTAVDIITRDIQQAGIALSSPSGLGQGNMASIFYTYGGGYPNPDSIMILNGDPYAPVADVKTHAAGSANFFVNLPTGLTESGNGSNQTFTYVVPGGTQRLYQETDNDPLHRIYICYDDTHAIVFSLTKDGQDNGNAGIQLQHNPTGELNPPSVFGTAVGGTSEDTGEPNYSSAKISVVGSMVGYRLNQTTNTLQRSVDLTNWYDIANGITSFNIQYRTVVMVGGVPTAQAPTPNPTDRKGIRSVIVTIGAKTVGLTPEQKGYRQETISFEVAPRNFNLVNNSNVG